MARSQACLHLTPQRWGSSNVPGKNEAVVRHDGSRSLVGKREGGTTAAAADAVEGEGFPKSGNGGSRDFNAMAKAGSRRSTNVTAKVVCSHFVPVPRKRVNLPYADRDLATRLVMTKRCARRSKTCRQPVPEVNAVFAAGRRGYIKSLSTTKGRKRSLPFVSLEVGKPFLENKSKVDGEEHRQNRQIVEERLREFRGLVVELQQKVRDPNMEAFVSMKSKGRTPARKFLGEVPGVEIGDEFYYRRELMVAGVHGSPIAGIDSVMFEGKRVATCVISHKFKGYVNLMMGSDVLVYSGEGGNPCFEGTGKNIRMTAQRMERGNMALKNSMDVGTPVRVVHGCRVNDGEPPKAETKSSAKYIYDGLYVVEDFKWEFGPGSFRVLKFQMRRLPGQRNLDLKQVLRARVVGSTEEILTAAGQTSD